MTPQSFSPIGKSFRTFIFVFCTLLFSINGFSVYAQAFRIPVNQYPLHLCSGGNVELHVVNKTTGSIANPIVVVDYGNNFDDISFIKKTATAKLLKTSGASYTVDTGRISGTQKKFYKINCTLNNGDSILLTIHLRPKCSYFSSIISSLGTSNILSNPYPLDNTHQPIFTFKLFSGTSYIDSITIYPATIKIAFPQIDISTAFQSALPNFSLAANTYPVLDSAGNCGRGNYLFSNFNNVFYKYIVLQNNGDTLDLTDTATLLKIFETRDNGSAIQYKINAAYIGNGSNTFSRIAANSTAPAKFIMRTGTGTNFGKDTLVFDRSILQLARGKQKLFPNDTLAFWEECELLPTTSSVNTSICNQISSTTYRTAINCNCAETGCNASLVCYRNIYDACNSILFQSRTPSFRHSSGKIKNDICYNLQRDTAAAAFSSYTNQYFLVLKNVWSGYAVNNGIEIATRDLNPTTRYLLTKSRLLNAAHPQIGVLNDTGKATHMPIINSFALPTGTTAIKNLRIQYFNGATAIPTNGTNANGSYYLIDSLIDQNGNPIVLKYGQVIVLIWEGYNYTTETCATIGTLDNWASRVITYDSCNHAYVHFGAEPKFSAGGNFATYFNPYGDCNCFFPEISPHSDGFTPPTMQGGGAKQIIGSADDNYFTAPAGTIKFSASQNNLTFLPAATNINQQSIAIKISIGALLNVWKGDIYNINVPCNRPDSCAAYDKNHLSKYVRFYTDISTTGNPQYVRVNPDCIGYLNSGIGNFHHYDSAGRPTALNGIEDVIYALFKPTTSNFNWLKKLYVEIDVQPACAHCPCSSQPYNANNNAYLAIAAQLKGSLTPVNISVLHIPDTSCGTEAIGNCVIPTNRYCIMSGDKGIVVQCPGCHIAGLYTVKSIGSRMNFGFEDKYNTGVADKPLKRILFNQIDFSTNYSVTLSFLNDDKIMYHDLFRVRHQSIVHLDDAYVNYSPTASTLTLPTSISHPYEKGFYNGYIRVHTSDSIGVINYKNPTDSMRLSKNIPSLVVWIVDGDTVKNNAYPYASGFNAFHPNINVYPYQTYSISAGKTDTVTPIFIFYDSTKDFRDNATHEFVYDFSIDRLQTAYSHQYGNNYALPFDYFHDKMKMFFDVTYSLNFNPSAGSSSVRNYDEVIDSKAYFTLSKETKSNKGNFFDMQDAADQKPRHDTATRTFVATKVLLDSLCPMGVSPYQVIINGITRRDCDSVRWYCVKGTTIFTRIGYKMEATTYAQPIFNFTGMSVRSSISFSYYKKFLLGNSNVVTSPNQLNIGTQFNYEHRNWSHCKQLEVTGLPQGSSISNVTAMQDNNHIGSNTPKIKISKSKRIAFNGIANSWLLNMDSLNATPIYNPTGNQQDSIQSSDDNEVVGFDFDVDYPACVDTVFSVKIKELDALHICDWNSVFQQNNFSALPLTSNYNACSNNVISNYSFNSANITSTPLTGNGTSGTLTNGKIAWKNMTLLQKFLNGKNPWITVQFPAAWNDAINSIDSIKLNGIKIPTYGQLANGIVVPKSLGNHTWLFFAPAAELAYNNNQPTTNYLSVWANYDCKAVLSDTSIVYLNGGVFADSSLFRLAYDTTTLHNYSCERTMQPLLANSLHPYLKPNDRTDYSQMGLCSPFNMRFTLINTGNDCIRKVSMKVNIPTGAGINIIPAIGYATTNTNNAVLIYNGQPYPFQLTNGINTLLNSLHSADCNNQPACLSGNSSNFNLPDSCQIIFGLQTDCNLSYAPVTTEFWGYSQCDTLFSNATSPNLFYCYPKVQGTFSFNQFSTSIADVPNSWNNGCQLPDSFSVNLSTGSFNASPSLQANNNVLLRLPTGVKITTVKFKGKTLPVLPFYQFSTCKNTALQLANGLSDTANLVEVSLANLSGLNLYLNNPLHLSVHFQMDSTVYCSDSIKAVVVTVGQASCTGSSTCNYCAAQTSTTVAPVFFSPPTPTISLNTLACSGKAILKATGGCSSYQWIANGNIISTTSDSITITATNTYYVNAKSTLFNNGNCTSDTSNGFSFVLNQPVVFSLSSVSPACDSSNGKITIALTQGDKPIDYFLYSGTNLVNSSLKDTSLTHVFNANSGAYIITVNSTAGCSKKDSTYVNVKGICGNTHLCISALQKYSISPVQNGVAYHWYCLKGSTVIDSSYIGYGNDYYNFQLNNAGVYTIKVVVQGVLGDTLTSKKLTIDVHPQPNPTIFPNNGFLGCKKFEQSYNDTCWLFCDSNAIKFSTPKDSGYIKHYWIVVKPNNKIDTVGIAVDDVTLFFSKSGVYQLQLIAVDTLTGCSQSAAKCVTIISKPHAKFYSLPLSNGGTGHYIRVCLNQQVLLTDTSHLPNGYYTYTWFDGNGKTSSVHYGSSIFNLSYAQPKHFKAGLIIETICHCTDTAWLDVFVDSVVGPDITCKSSVCYGDTAVYTTSYIGCARYYWNVTGGTIINPIPYNTSHTIQVVWNGKPVNGGGRISLRLNGCGGYYCTDTSYINIPFVKPVDTIHGSVTVCAGSTACYYISPVAGAAYKWRISGNGAVAITDSTNNYFCVLVQPNASFTLNVQYSNCTLGCTGNGIPLHVTANSNSNYAIQCLTQNVNCNKACNSDTTRLTTNVSPHTFKWYVKNGAGTIVDSSSTLSSSFSIVWSKFASAISVATNYQVLAKDNSGAYCNAGSNPLFIITVYPSPPTLTSTAIGQYSCICPNNSITLNGSPQNGNYLRWDVIAPTASGNPAKGNGNTFSTTLSGSYSDSFTIAVRQVMPAFPSCTSQSYNLVVRTCKAPSGGITGIDSVCINSISGLVAPQGYDTYNWSMENNTDGTIIGGQGTNQANIQWNAPPNGARYLPNGHNVRLDLKFCGATAPSSPKFYAVDITPPPAIHLIAPTVICSGSAVVFNVAQNTSSSCNMSGWFIWNYGDGKIDSTQFPFSKNHIYASAGSYKVTVAVQNAGTYHQLQTSASTTITVLAGIKLMIAPLTSPCGLQVFLTQTGTPNYTFDWYSKTASYANYTLLSSSAVQTTSPTSYSFNTGYYKLIVTDQNGCTATDNTILSCGSTPPCPTCPPPPPCPTVFTGTVNVSTTPCTGNVSVSYAVTGTTAYTKRTLSFGDGTTIALTANSATGITHTYQHVGIYTVQVVYSFANGNPPSCSNTFSQQIQISVLPKAAQLYTCSGASAQHINATIKDISEILLPPKITSAWHCNTATLTPQTGNQATISNAYFDTTYVVTDSVNGCFSSDTFRTPPMPVAAYNPIPLAPVCEGTPVEFKDTSTPANHIIGRSWKWDDKTASGGNLIYSNLQNPVEAFNFDGNSAPKGFVNVNYLTITDDHLCTATTTGNYFVRQNSFQFPTTIVLSTSSPSCNGTPNNINVAIQTSLGSSPLHPRFTDSLFKASGNSQPAALVKVVNHQSNPSYVPVSNTGMYYVTVRDSFGCSAQSANGVSPTFINTPTVQIQGSSRIICAKDAVDFTMFCGNQYTYQWSIRPAISGFTPPNTATMSIPKGIIPYTASGYQIIGTITNSNCPVTDSIKLTVNALPSIAASITTNPTNYCLMLPTDSVQLNAGSVFSGGKLPYSYSWTGSTKSSVYVNHPAAYSCYVTDANGCQSSAQQIVIAAPPVFDALVAGCFEVCDTANICLPPNAPTHQWFFNTLTHPLSAPYVAANGNLHTSLSGSYYLQLCDSRSCCSVSPPIDLQVVNCTLCCFKDTAYVDSTWFTGIATGGLLQYKFRMRYKNSCVRAIDSLVMTDVNGSGGTVSNITPQFLPSGWNTIIGTYTTTHGGLFCPIMWRYYYNNQTHLQELLCDGYSTTCVSLNTGCSATLQAGGATTICLGDSVTLTASPNSGVSYQWYLNGALINGASAKTYKAKVTGNYYAVVTFSNGCMTVSNTIAITVNSVSAFAAVVANCTCNAGTNGSVTVSNISGGNSPYTYSWNTTPVKTTQTISSLAAGTYTVTVTDAIGCKTTSFATVTQPTAINASAYVVSLVSCVGGTNGSVAVTNATGGTVGYTYSWNTSPVKTTQTISSLATGSYTVTVTDAHSCTANFSVGLSAANIAPAIASQPTNVYACSGTPDTVSFTISNGANGLSYAWSQYIASNSQPGLDNGSGGYGYTAMGITTAKLILSNPSSSISYKCTVTNACGSVTTTKINVYVNNITLPTVTPSSSIICPSSPAGNLYDFGALLVNGSPAGSGFSSTSCINCTFSGNAATFSIANYPNLTYQWQVLDSASTNSWSNLSGKTSSSYTHQATSSYYAHGCILRCKISLACNSSVAIYSNVAYLIMHPWVTQTYAPRCSWATVNWLRPRNVTVNSSYTYPYRVFSGSNNTTNSTNATTYTFVEYAPGSLNQTFSSNYAYTDPWGNLVWSCYKPYTNCGTPRISKPEDSTLTTLSENGNLVQVYPNPLREDILNVEYSLSEPCDYIYVDVLDMFGRVIIAEQLQMKAGQTDGRTVLDMQGKASGLYFVSVRCNNFNQKAKVVVVH